LKTLRSYILADVANRVDQATKSTILDRLVRLPQAFFDSRPVGQVMFYGPGAGAGPTASAVVADILNIAGIREATGANGGLDPLLAAGQWRPCRLVDPGLTLHRNYLRLQTGDQAGVIGRIGTCFGDQGVSIRSIVQFETSGDAADAEIVVITHEVQEANFRRALAAIEALPDVKAVAACLRTL